jgi:peroxiredoxin
MSWSKVVRNVLTLLLVSQPLGQPLNVRAAEASAASAIAAPDTAGDVCPIKVGSRIPQLSLRTPANKAFDLNAAIARKPTVLIFYRGGWCPYCNLQLAQLQKAETQLLKLGYQVLAVSPDTPAELNKSLQKNGLKYTLLSDSTMTAAQALGIAFRVDAATLKKYNEYGIDLEKSSGQKHHLLPVPAVFVLDTKGTIQFSYVNPDYTVRLAPEVLLAAAKAALPQPKPKAAK